MCVWWVSKKNKGVLSFVFPFSFISLFFCFMVPMNRYGVCTLNSIRGELRGPVLSVYAFVQLR